MEQKLNQFKAQLGEIDDLHKAAAILEWDQQAYMPPGGAGARAVQLATLQRLAHDKFTSAEVGNLLGDLEAETRDMPYEDDTVSLLRVTRREYDKACRLPSAFVSELVQATALATSAWIKAREGKDWAQFEPHLERIIDLKKREAEYVGYQDHIYDALLDTYEPNMKTAQVKEIFAEVRSELVPLVRAIAANADRVDASVLTRDYDEDKQWALASQALQAIGYDFQRGRMDAVPHPFCTTFSNQDVRVTNRVMRNYLGSCFFGAMHEGGHALYELGSPDRFERTPLAGGTSLGAHESQSRLWENLVGRSREFWRFFFPTFRRAFRKNAADMDAEKMYRAVNKVEPSLIRVEADEVTYNLHIMLRFEMENELLEGKLRVRDVPERWNVKFQDYLGITPPDISLGAMQDVHWSSGLVGYFPTYALGTFFSAQLFDKACQVMPDLKEQFARGEFDRLRAWLTEKMYQHGRKFTLNELAQRITGEPPQTRSYIKYLKDKYSEIYSL